MSRSGSTLAHIAMTSLDQMTLDPYSPQARLLARGTRMQHVQLSTQPAACMWRFTENALNGVAVACGLRTERFAPSFGSDSLDIGYCYKIYVKPCEQHLVLQLCSIRSCICRDSQWQAVNSKTGSCLRAVTVARTWRQNDVRWPSSILVHQA